MKLTQLRKAIETSCLYNKDIVLFTVLDFLLFFQPVFHPVEHYNSADCGRYNNVGPNGKVY